MLIGDLLYSGNGTNVATSHALTVTDSLPLSHLCVGVALLPLPSCIVHIVRQVLNHKWQDSSSQSGNHKLLTENTQRHSTAVLPEQIAFCGHPTYPLQSMQPSTCSRYFCKALNTTAMLHHSKDTCISEGRRGEEGEERSREEGGEREDTASYCILQQGVI